MRSRPYRPLKSYLDGGRSDAGWASAEEGESRKSVTTRVTSDLEADARKACTELLNDHVERAVYPHARPTRSIRLYLRERKAVIATRRATPARAELEVKVLQALHGHGVHVPGILGFDGKILLQEDLGKARLTTALKRADPTEGERLLDATLASLAEAHRAAAAAGLERHVVTLGESETWRRDFITHTRALGAFLATPPPRLPVTKLIERLKIDKPAFVKWDARPPNAIIQNGGQIAWIDWEHCGRRNSLDDLAWLLGDQTVPDWPEAEERLLEKYVPDFVNGGAADDAQDYLAAFGTFHMCYRIGKIVHRARKDVAREIEGINSDHWQSVLATGKVSADALTKARRTAIRASRWAARSSLTAHLSPWLFEVAELFKPSDSEVRDHGDAHDKPSARPPRELGQSPNAEVASVSLPTLAGSRILWGKNVHHDATVIRLEVAFGDLTQLTSSAAGPEFPTRFIDRFGSLRMLNDGDEIDPEFLRRLESADGVPLSEVFLQAILAVEGSLAFAMCRLDPIGFANVIDTPDPSRAILVWHCRRPGVSRRAAQVALIGLKDLLPIELTQHTKHSDEDEFRTAYDDLLFFARRKGLDYNTSIVVQAAERRGIPWEQLRGQFTRLGQGKFQQRINKTATENTSFVAQRLGVNKRITQGLLTDAGIPVPQQQNAMSVEAAVTAADRIGYPVVLKPLDGSSGRGVIANIKSVDEIPAAFEHAQQHHDVVIVESFIEGKDHRLLVVDGRFIAATKRIAASVTGDGQASIAALIERLNDDPRRDGFTLIRIEADDDLDRLLDRAGYTLDTVLASDETFVLRSIANYHAGGTTIDITDEVHPDNAELAIRASEAMGLNIAGVDLVMPDVTKSYKEVGGAIIEVNARPGIDLHTRPAAGQPRDAAGAIIETIYPPGTQGRVPVALVAGARGATAVARMLGSFLQASNRVAGVVTIKDGTVDGEKMNRAGFQRRRAITRVLRDPRLEVLIDSTSALRIANGGLIHDACEISAIMPDVGDLDIEEIEKGLTVLVAATRGKIIVAGDNDLALAAVAEIAPSRLLLVAQQDNEAIRRHREAGGEAALIVRGNGADETVLFSGQTNVASYPLATTDWRRVRAQLFAVALAHHIGISGEVIAAVLERT